MPMKSHTLSLGSRTVGHPKGQGGASTVLNSVGALSLGGEGQNGRTGLATVGMTKGESHVPKEGTYSAKTAWITTVK